MSSTSGYGRDHVLDPQPDDEPSEIVEGFLCPICHRDLKSFEFLTQHFEKYHSEDQDALKSIFKDIFQKAKDKIKQNFDDSFAVVGNRGNGTHGSVGGVGVEENFPDGRKSSKRHRKNVISDPRQEIGIQRCHFEYFNSIRRPWLERHASETNKLTLRLQRLLKDRPKDAVLRKQHEQNIVTWLDGTAVKLCPNCAKSFHLARRQHHCRLCGSIICQQCSHFLKIADAVEMTTLLAMSVETTRHNLESLQLKDCNNASANSFLSTERENTSGVEDDLRCCIHCLLLLEARKDLLAGRNEQPPITKLYEEIHQIRERIHPDIKTYRKAIQSLYNGDTTYTLRDATELRSNIARMAEIINLKCRNVCSLPCETGSRSSMLQRSIRLSCCQFIQENVLALSQLPREEEIAEIQQRKRLEAEARIALEQRMVMEAYEKQESTMRNMMTSVPEAINYATGSDLQSLDNWICNNSVNSSVASGEDCDPLIEQINIIKGYIKQAKEDGHQEVLQTLERNLRELQTEFYNRQRAETQSTDTISE